MKRVAVLLVLAVAGQASAINTTIITVDNLCAYATWPRGEWYTYTILEPPTDIFISTAPAERLADLHWEIFSNDPVPVLLRTVSSPVNGQSELLDSLGDYVATVNLILQGYSGTPNKLLYWKVPESQIGEPGPYWWKVVATYDGVEVDHAWASPVPAPGALSLVLVGLGLLHSRKRRG